MLYCKHKRCNLFINMRQESELSKPNLGIEKTEMSEGEVKEKLDKINVALGKISNDPKGDVVRMHVGIIMSLLKKLIKSGWKDESVIEKIRNTTQEQLESSIGEAEKSIEETIKIKDQKLGCTLDENLKKIEEEIQNLELIGVDCQERRIELGKLRERALRADIDTRLGHWEKYPVADGDAVRLEQMDFDISVARRTLEKIEDEAFKTEVDVRIKAIEGEKSNF